MEQKAFENECVECTSCDCDTAQEVSNDADGAVNMAEESAGNGDISSKMAEDASQWQDKYLRLAAEFDNYRKRTLKEKMDLISSGGEDIIKSLLTVLDDIDRAMEAMEKTDNMESVKEGVHLIHQKLTGVLKAKGLEEIEALGKELDTDLHDAIAKIPAAEDAHRGKIVDVVQKGYKYKDKVARFAKVAVGE